MNVPSRVRPGGRKLGRFPSSSTAKVGAGARGDRDQDRMERRPAGSRPHGWWQPSISQNAFPQP